MIVVAVEYLNTRPFIYGITHAGSVDLRDGLVTAIPAECAAAFTNGTADISLVPVGALQLSDLNNVITPYCISATGRVETVALLSDCELGEIKTIYLDTHSRTSVQLVRVLARELWDVNPEFIDGIPSGKVLENEAIVAIGDKVFDLEKLYSSKVDLAEDWQTLTSLPFVFAAWVARTPKGKASAQDLERALKFGVENREKSIPHDEHYARNISYLTKNIEFEFTDAKKQAVELFLKKIRK